MLRGEPPLNMAIHFKRTQAVKLLLAHGANPNPDIKANSPLELAVFYGVESDIFNSLLDHNAIIGENTDDVLGVFEMALTKNKDKDEINQRIINQHIDTIDPKKLILWIIELNPKVKNNVQKILTNTLTCILEKHQNILNYEADKNNSKLLVGEAFLFSAVKSGNAEMVELLLQHKVKLNCYDEEGYSPLHRAALTGNTNVAKILINAEANVDVIGKEVPNKAIVPSDLYAESRVGKVAN